MLEPVIENPWVRAAALLLALVGVAFIAYLLSPVLVPLFFAFLVAYAFDPVIDFFERRKVSRNLSIAALAILAIGIAVALPLFVVPGVIHEAQDLAEAAQARVAAQGEQGGVSGWLEDMVRKIPLDSVAEALDLVDPDVPGFDPNYDPLPLLTIHFSNLVEDRALEFLKSDPQGAAERAGAAGTTVARFFTTIGRGLLGTVLFLANLALFAFVSVYLLKDYDRIVETAGGLVPPKHRETITRIFKDIDSQLKGFLRGQMLVCLCLGVMYAIGLSIAGVPFALPLAAFGAVASFVPYLGLALTIGPAVVLCILQYQGLDWHLIVVLATFTLAQVLEGTVITPKVVGDQVGLGPVWVILAVLVFGNALGFLGLLLAVPIAATLKVFILEALALYRKSEIFSDPGAV